MLLNSFLVIVLCVPCFKLFERATSTLLLLKKQCDVSLQHQVTEVKKLYCRQSNLPMRFFCSVSSFLSDLHKIHLMSFIIHNKVYAAYKYKRQVSQPFFVIQNSGFARVKPQQRRQRRNEFQLVLFIQQICPAPRPCCTPLKPTTGKRVMKKSARAALVFICKAKNAKQ